LSNRGEGRPRKAEKKERTQNQKREFPKGGVAYKKPKKKKWGGRNREGSSGG